MASAETSGNADGTELLGFPPWNEAQPENLLIHEQALATEFRVTNPYGAVAP